MFFDKRVKTHGIKKKKKKDRFFSRNGAGISEDPCQIYIYIYINLDTENNIFHKIKLLFIHYPNYFHRNTLLYSL